MQCQATTPSCSLPSFHLKIPTSLNGVVLKYVNSFRIANPSYLNFSYFWKRSFVGFYTIPSTSLSNSFLKTYHHERHCWNLLIMILNFNLYGVVCTIPSPICIGLLFGEGICLTMQHDNCFLMFMRPCKSDITTSRGLIENCIGF